MKKLLFLLTLLLACLLVASCSCEDEDAVKVDPSKCEHYWDNGKVIEQATVTKVGKISYTCVLCDATREEATPKLHHDHEYENGAWKSDRLNHWYDCLVENCTVKGSKGSHAWQEEILVESNPTTTGTKKFTCTVCAFTKEEDYRALATVVADGYKSATTVGAFENVTYESYVGSELALYVELADDKVLIGTTVYEDGPDTLYGKHKLSAIFEGIGFGDFEYDAETRAYFYKSDTKRLTLQFADGRIYSLVLQSIKNGEIVTEKLVFSKYGKTVIEE